MDLRADLSQLYSLKSALEDLLGNQAWLDLKESGSLTKWKKYFVRALDALALAIEATVLVRDDDWVSQVKANIDRGREGISKAKDFDETLSVFSATLLRQSFLQLGRLPSRQHQRLVPLKRENWCLSAERSVQYTQTRQQLEDKFRAEQRRAIGFDKQFDLETEYRASRSDLSYSVWCMRREA
jgi:hypothetical protein